MTVGAGKPQHNAPMAARSLAVAERIGLLIRSGDLRPHEQLASERALARRFGVGRSTIREALRALERSGVIEIRDRRGSYVKEFHHDLLVPPGVSMLAGHVDDIDLFHTLEVRRVAETALAELAALRHEERHLAAMAGNLERMDQAVANDLDTVLLDVEFHGLIADASGNPVFARMLESISSLLVRSREISSRAPGAVAKALAYHRLIYEAIRSRDAAGARSLMELHLADTDQQLHQELERQARHTMRGTEGGESGTESR